MKNFIPYVASRAKEVSTWQGIAVLLTAFGVSISPEQWQAITTVGTGLFGALSVFLPEGKSK